MVPARAEAFDHRKRSAAGCLCCGSERLTRTVQPVSGFLAARAWDGKPEITQLLRCETCGLRFFERGMDDAEAEHFYLGYRDANYQRHRQSWEPFYTLRRHASLVAWSDAPVRRENLRRSLVAATAPQRFASVLDHGGSRGQMLAGIDAGRKAVFDPAAEPAIEGVETFSRATDLPGGWSLVLSCQVLEHISNPAAYLRHLHGLLSDDGWLYLEVPNEQWLPAAGPEAWRTGMLRTLLQVDAFLIAADMFCTVCRIKLGRLPPLGFVAMREHLNYFTARALSALLATTDFHVEACGIDDGGQLFAVARKYATGATRTRNTASTSA